MALLRYPFTEYILQDFDRMRLCGGLYVSRLVYSSRTRFYLRIDEDNNEFAGGRSAKSCERGIIGDK